MTDTPSDSHDSLMDDSWFDGEGERAEKKKRRAISRADVFAALEKAGLETAATPEMAVWDGLDDSWFDRPRRNRR